MKKLDWRKYAVAGWIGLMATCLVQAPAAEVARHRGETVRVARSLAGGGHAFAGSVHVRVRSRGSFRRCRGRYRVRVHRRFSMSGAFGRRCARARGRGRVRIGVRVSI